MQLQSFTFLLLLVASTTPIHSLAHESVEPEKQKREVFDNMSFFVPSSTQYCVERLAEADANGDKKVNDQEFVDFLRLFVGMNTTPRLFQQLPLDHITIFYSAACAQCFQLTGEHDCCVGDKGLIDISNWQALKTNGDDSRNQTDKEEYRDGTLEFLCSSLSKLVKERSIYKSES